MNSELNPLKVNRSNRQKQVAQAPLVKRKITKVTKSRKASLELSSQNKINTYFTGERQQASRRLVQLSTDHQVTSSDKTQGTDLGQDEPDKT